MQIGHTGSVAAVFGGDVEVGLGPQEVTVHRPAAARDRGDVAQRITPAAHLRTEGPAVVVEVAADRDPLEQRGLAHPVLARNHGDRPIQGKPAGGTQGPEGGHSGDPPGDLGTCPGRIKEVVVPDERSRMGHGSSLVR